MTTTASTTEPAGAQPSLVERALRDRIPNPTGVDLLIAEHLECSFRTLGDGFASPAGKDRTTLFLYSAALGSVAYLLRRFQDAHPGLAEDIADELDQLLSFGEPLADWVAEELTKLGVDLEELRTDAADDGMTTPDPDPRIERAARAIWTYLEGHDKPGASDNMGSWDDGDDEDHDRAREVARAALDAAGGAR